MGLTSIAYIVGIIILILGSYTRDRLGGEHIGHNIFMVALGFGLFAILIGASVDISTWSRAVVPLFFFKLAYVTLFIGVAYVLRFAIIFPYELHSRFVAILYGLISAGAAWFVFFSGSFVKTIGHTGDNFIIDPGYTYFSYIVGGIWALIAAAGLLLLVRSFFLKSNIYRLQSRIIGLTLLLSGALGFFLQFPAFEYAPVTFPLIALPGFLMLLGIYWAISITKLFDIRDLLRRSLSSVAFAILVGTPVGILAALILMAQGLPAIIPVLGVPLLFVGAAYFFTFISNLLSQAFNIRGNYLDTLERGLSDIDFSQGRGIIFEKLSSLLCDSMSFNDFSVLLENADGNLETAYSNFGAKLTIEHQNSPFEFVINMKTDILLKTEAIANHNFNSVKGQLLTIYDALKAEALIILREGHHIIGLIALGQKRSSADYTAYDAQVLRMIYGKLFAIGFYLKNIAKESILTTVDRELQYSNQIIASIQENIDKVDHPKTDLAFVSKSTRKLGGDFIDFVKLAPDRWFFIVGDVSGKGLNASMSMVILKSTIRLFLREEKDFNRLVVKVNAFIKNNLPRGTFFAGVFGLFDFSKDKLYFINCGVPVMFLYSPQFNNVVEVQGEGRVLGFVKDYEPYLKLRKISLQKGSILFITTDGIVDSESIRNERFGKERVQRCVSDFRNYNAETMVQMTMGSLQTFISGDLEDDITVMALKYQCDN
jgi:hypothetical protein